MTEKLVWLMSIIVVGTCLGGCQLAREKAGVQDTIPEDRLVGVYITSQHLGSTKDYYAQEILVEEDGHETTSFEFKDVPGIAFFSPTIKSENNPDGYTTTILGKTIPSVKEIWHRAGPQVAFGQTVAWGQPVAPGLNPSRKCFTHSPGSSGAAGTHSPLPPGNDRRGHCPDSA